MASFFGSVATSLGEGIQENAGERRKEEMARAEHLRQLALEKQRQQFESKLLDKRIAADNTRSQTEVQARIDLEKNRQGFELEDRNRQRRADREKTLMQEYSDMWQAAIGLYSKHSGTRSFSGNGLKVETKSELVDVIQPDGTFTKEKQERSYVYSKGRSPMRLENGVFQHIGGDVESPYDFGGSLDLKTQAEDDLASGNISEKDFLEAFKYLPVDYVWGQVSEDASDFKSFLETNSIRLPSFSEFMQSKSGGSESDVIRGRMEYGLGADKRPMTPSMEAMSDSPEAQAQKAENDAYREELKEEAKIGGPLAEAQAAAAAEEKPDLLTSGGNLQGPPEAAPPEAAPLPLTDRQKVGQQFGYESEPRTPGVPSNGYLFEGRLAQAAQQGIQDKPWMTNPTARANRGLSLSDEDVADLVSNMQTGMRGQ